MHTCLTGEEIEFLKSISCSISVEYDNYDIEDGRGFRLATVPRSFTWTGTVDLSDSCFEEDGKLTQFACFMIDHPEIYWNVAIEDVTEMIYNRYPEQPKTIISLVELDAILNL